MINICQLHANCIVIYDDYKCPICEKETFQANYEDIIEAREQEKEHYQMECIDLKMKIRDLEKKKKKN